MLLDRGLIRVFLPWPPRAVDGSVIAPEFEIEVIRDLDTGRTWEISFWYNPDMSIHHIGDPEILNTVS